MYIIWSILCQRFPAERDGMPLPVKTPLCKSDPFPLKPPLVQGGCCKGTPSVKASPVQGEVGFAQQNSEGLSILPPI